ncbi:MAG: hypothetical protein HOV81_15265 [Kofleriaceae bacterium]|nr:hypothetical protein [Kofleriaceae bacterium]
MSSPTDPASLALAGNLVVTSADRRLRVAGAATSTLPVSLEYIYAALRDADGRLIDVPGTFLRTRTGESHELALEQFVGASTLRAARSIELTLPYRLEISTDLASARLGRPGPEGRVPVDITTRGNVPFVDIISIAAYFDGKKWNRGLSVFVELDIRRGEVSTYCSVSGRVHGEDDNVLAEGNAYSSYANNDASRSIFEIWLPYAEGTATRLELPITVKASGIGRLGPIAVEGL